MTDPVTQQVLRALGRGSNTYRGLPDPDANVESLYTTVVALKEAVETLLRSRNNPSESALLVKEAAVLLGIAQTLSDAQVSKLENTEPGVTDHGQLTGLDDDDHAQYAPRDDVDLLNAFKTAYRRGFKEFTYSNGFVTRIDIWRTDDKIVKLFTKTLTYTGNQVTKVVTTDELSGLTLQKDLTYNGIEVSTITEVLS